MMGVRPDSRSRRDTFLLLRVAARLRRPGRVGSCVVRQARTPTQVATWVRCGTLGRNHNLNTLRRQEKRTNTATPA